MQGPSNRRLFVGLFLAAVVATAAFVPAVRETVMQLLHPASSVVKIGVAQPMSGPLGALGQDMYNGVKLAVDELNKSGFKVKGRPVVLELVGMDDRANAETGKQVAQELVDAGVVAVIGHLNSGVSIAAAPVYASKSISQLAISTNPQLTQLELPTTFRLVANDTLQARAIGSFAANQLGAKRYALLDVDNPYGKGLGDGAAAQLRKAGSTIVLRQSFGDTTTEFDAVAGKLKEANVDAIVSTLSDFQVLALIKALKKIDYTHLSILGGDTLKTTAALEGATMIGGGLYATSPILEPSEFPGGVRFLDAYKAAFKVDPAYGGHYSYDAMYVLSSAIQRSESLQPEAINRALRNVNGYAPVTGSMKFDARGEQRYGAISVYRARNGVWEAQMRSDTW